MDIIAAEPQAVLPDGILDLICKEVPAGEYARLRVVWGTTPARILLLRSDHIRLRVPAEAEGNRVQVFLGDELLASTEVLLGQAVLTHIHAVDNPVVDSQGYVYTTYSGRRDETPPVSVYRVHPDGTADHYVTAVRNATALALDPQDILFVSSRFEGRIYKVLKPDQLEVYAENVGVPFGMTFNDQGVLFVGDREGRILKIHPNGEQSIFLELPASPIAYHLAFDPDGNLFVSVPNLAHDRVYMVDPFGHAIPFYTDFGRPHGLAFDREGNLYIAKGHSWDSGVYRITAQGAMEKILAGPPVVGLAFDREGNVWVNTAHVLYRLPLGIHPPSTTASNHAGS